MVTQPRLAVGEARRIAVFRALYLGDLLCAVPALRALRQRFPTAEITLIGLPWARELVERLPYLDRFLPFPGWPGLIEAPYDTARTDGFLAEARAAGYDLAIQMHGDGSVSNSFVAALGARQSLGYGPADDDRLTLALPHDPTEHEILRWLRLAAATGAPSDDTRLEFPITAGEATRADALLRDAPAGIKSRHALFRVPRPAIRVGVHPGAKDPTRRWPPARFTALADALVERYGARIVLTGSTGEREVTAAVRRAMRFPALDLAGATDLGTFAAIISQLDLLVTNDTGASHLAAATGTRSVVLFGPTRPAQWAPLDCQRHRVVDAHTLIGPAMNPAVALHCLPIAPVLTICRAALAAAQAPSDLPTGDPRPIHAEAACDD